MKLLSVREAQEKMNSLVEEEFFLHGTLKVIAGDVLIDHWPNSKKANSPNSEIWCTVGDGVFQFEQRVLNRLNAKRVVLRGVVKTNNTQFSQDAGLWWSTHFVATALTSFRKWQEEHGGI